MTRTIAEEILAALPSLMAEHPLGPHIGQVASALSMDRPSARLALFALEADGRARIVRRGPAMHLVPADYPHRVCPICRAEVKPKPKSKRVTCSRSCAVALSWKNETTSAQRKASIRAERTTPKARARLAAHNKRRWAKPEEHAKLSEQNRRRARDPVVKAQRSIVMSAKNGTPEKRAMYSAIRKAYWADPARRQKMIDGMRRSKQTPEAMAKFSALMKARWQDPVWRAKWTEANKRRNDHIRGKKLTTKQKQQRREARERNKAAQAEGAPA
jgi:hypothetical protein